MNYQLQTKYFFLTIVLVVLQVYLGLQGVSLFGKYLNPVLLLLTWASTAVTSFYYLVNKYPLNPISKHSPLIKWILFLGGVVWVTLVYQDGFHRYPDPALGSDVIPQLEAQYDRFIRGEQPYYPLQTISYHPFPVYMPAHWIVLALPKLLHWDVRWVGPIMLCISIGLFVINFKKYDLPLFAECILIILFFFIPLSFSFWLDGDIFITLELPITAFYLLLALGLINRNLFLIAAMISLCLLSRYTLVFWLPLFALIFLQEKPIKQNVLLWLFILLSIVIFYIIPFLLKSPHILTDGVAYHNKAAIAEWYGYGEPPVSWSHETGIYFAPLLKEFFTGDAVSQVYKTRILQAALMILLNIIGWIGYKKYKSRIHYLDYSLIMLYLFLVVFYSVGALTYRYYLITVFSLAVSLCVMISRKRIVKRSEPL